MPPPDIPNELKAPAAPKFNLWENSQTDTILLCTDGSKHSNRMTGSVWFCTTNSAPQSVLFQGSCCIGRTCEIEDAETHAIQEGLYQLILQETNERPARPNGRKNESNRIRQKRLGGHGNPASHGMPGPWKVVPVAFRNTRKQNSRHTRQPRRIGHGRLFTDAIHAHMAQERISQLHRPGMTAQRHRQTQMPHTLGPPLRTIQQFAPTDRPRHGPDAVPSHCGGFDSYQTSNHMPLWLSPPVGRAYPPTMYLRFSRLLNSPAGIR